MTTRVLETEADLNALIALLQQRKLPMTVQVKDGRNRSLQQNALLAKWYGEAAEQLGDRTFAEVRAECKLTMGVPILRRDDERFRETYDRVLKPLTYEEKLRLVEMTELPVTRCFSVRQMREYMDAVSQHFAEAGVRLTDPDEMGRAA